MRGTAGGVAWGVLERHEALRSTIGPEGTELVIGGEPRLALNRLDLRALGAQAAEQRLADERRLAVETPFDLGNGPLVRATLASTSDTSHELILTAHHIVCDGWSLGVMSHDLMRLYRARSGRRCCAGAGLPIRRPSRSRAPGCKAERERDERYWIGVHDGGGMPLELPCDRPRPAYRSFASRREDLVIDAGLAQAARKLAARHGSSLFSTLFGLFGALVGRLSGTSDVVVGVPAAGQAAAGHDDLVGHCLNLLPVRLSFDIDQGAKALLEASRTATLDAYDHQQCTLGGLLQKLQLPRDPSRLPLVSVLFNLDTAIAESGAVGRIAAPFGRGNPRSFENFELFLNVSQIDDTLVLECQYNTDLFDAATVQRWLELYAAALQRLAADDTCALAAALAPTDAERGLLARFNASTADHDRIQAVDDLIAAQASATPDAVAVVSGERSMRYGELQARADALAQALQSRGIGPGERVGISCSRNEHMLVAMLGVLRCGAGYVPLDPSFPADRLAFMASDAKLRIVATDAGVDGPWHFPGAEPLAVDTLAPLQGFQGPARSVDDVAYVIYTSGSTGRPKGVLVPHRAVVNFLHSMKREPGLTAADRLVAVTTLSFDIAVLELLLPLSVGATVVLASRDEVADGQALRSLVEGSKATVMQATPSSWRLLIDAGWQGGSAFKALVGGEPLPADLARQLLVRTGELWNMYGPTETTVWSSCWRVHDPERGIPIGAPIANTRFDVVDDKLRLLPMGAIGELVIAGEGVTLGYHERPDLNGTDRFVPDPLGLPVQPAIAPETSAAGATTACSNAWAASTTRSSCAATASSWATSNPISQRIRRCNAHWR
ncbi:MAG: AMP-binding protein [Piscinibacter sp.]|nr:AMP-binding protein [Piscinibacter sp.]